MKAIITGAAGFIGAALIKSMVSNGWEVLGIDNFSPYYSVDLKRARLQDVEQHLKTLDRLDAFKFREMDCLELTLDSGEVRGECADIIVHLAAQPGVAASQRVPERYLRDNVTVFMHMLEQVRQSGTPMVFASSSTVYGEQGCVSLEKSRIDKPLSVYGATKSCNEILAAAYSRSFGLSLTGLRFFSVYGPWGRPDMFYYIATKSILEHKIISINGDGTIRRDMTYIADAVNVLETTVNEGVSNSDGFLVYDVGFGNVVSVSEIIELVSNHLGITAEIEHQKARSYDMAETLANNIHPLYINGYKSVSINEGSWRFVDWIKSYGRY